MKVDSWHIVMRMKAPKEGSCVPIAPLELPHSLHAFHHVSRADTLKKERHHIFRGGFWNYFSIGMDAQVSYAFHSERKLHPEKFRHQLVNQKHCTASKCQNNEKARRMDRPPHTQKVAICCSIICTICIFPFESPKALGLSSTLICPAFLEDLILGEKLTRRSCMKRTESNLSFRRVQLSIHL